MFRANLAPGRALPSVKEKRPFGLIKYAEIHGAVLLGEYRIWLHSRGTKGMWLGIPLMPLDANVVAK